VYGSLGPVMAINTLDLERNVQGRLIEEDARSIAPGASAALGVEARVLPRLRGFAEIHSSIVYPSFQFSDRTLSPRLLNLYGSSVSAYRSRPGHIPAVTDTVTHEQHPAAMRRTRMQPPVG
jgi:hypothetical protein